MRGFKVNKNRPARKNGIIYGRIITYFCTHIENDIHCEYKIKIKTDQKKKTDIFYKNHPSITTLKMKKIFLILKIYNSLLIWIIIDINQKTHGED